MENEQSGVIITQMLDACIEKRKQKKQQQQQQVLPV